MTCIDMGLSVGTVASLRRYDVFSEDAALVAAASAALFLAGVARCLPARQEQSPGFGAASRAPGKDLRLMVAGTSSARPENVPRLGQLPAQSNPAHAPDCCAREHLCCTMGKKTGSLLPENYRTGDGAGQAQLAGGSASRDSTALVRGTKHTRLLSCPLCGFWKPYLTPSPSRLARACCAETMFFIPQSVKESTVPVPGRHSTEE